MNLTTIQMILQIIIKIINLVQEEKNKQGAEE